MSAEEAIKAHIRRFDALKAERANFNAQWEEGSALVLPAYRDTFVGQSAMQGQKNTERQFDATAAFALQRFGAVMESIATPQNSRWHRLAPSDKLLKKNRQVRIFFEDLTDALFAQRYRPNANFVGNIQQSYIGLGAYGNGVVFIDQPEKEPGVRYRNIHLGEAYFAEDHAGVIDTMYRKFALTARQLVQKFGDMAPEKAKEDVKDANKAETKYDVLHCVFPRDDYSGVRKDAKGMPFASLYIAVNEQKLMRESGYRSFPYAVGRYTQASGELYGRGPTQFVLPNIKVLNEQKYTVLKQGHRIVDPVLLSHDDGNLGSFSLKSGALNPGGLNKDGKRLIDVLPTGNIAVGEKMMDIEKAVINDAFLITLFQILVETPQMTATEVLERAREKGMLLAPTAGRLQSEFLGRMIERELDVLSAQGLLPPLPGVLDNGRGIGYVIEYDSPMSRMQRAEKAAGFMRSLQMAAEYAANTQDPEPLDWFDFDAAIPEILDIQGAPTSWTRTLADVQKRREGRGKAMQQQQMVDAAPAMASIVKAAPKQGTSA